MPFTLLFPVLDVLLAAFVMALLMSFWTPSAARASTANMRVQYARLRFGLLLVAAGILVSVLNAGIPIERGDEARDLVELVTFPVYYVAIVLIESATWPPRRATPRGVSA